MLRQWWHSYSYWRHPCWLWPQIKRATRLALYDINQWNDESKWESLASLMEWQLTEMIRHWETPSPPRWHPGHVGDEKDIKRMKIARHMLQRLRADDYYEDADLRHPDRGKAWAEMWTALEEHDEATLFRQLRHMRGWWM